VTKGRVHLVVEGSPIFYNCFMRGSYLGEIELFIGCPRIDNAKVVGIGEFLCLSKSNFAWIV